MAIFKKLSVGDIVATSGTRVFRKLTTAEVTPEDPTLPIWNGTDLTGTTWYISPGFTANAGYGVFDVVGIVTSVNEFGTHNNEFENFYIGYVAPSAFTPFEEYENSIGFNQIGANASIHTSEEKYRWFTFNGGADTTNPRLIDWLLQNAKLTSHQLDLVGTWVFNDTITELPVFDDTVENVYGEYGINQATHIHLSLFSTSTAFFKPRDLAMCNKLTSVLGGDTVALCGGGTMSIPFYYYERNAFYQDYFWSETAYNELTFKDTSAFTNYSGVYVGEKFYVWLRANATKNVAGLYDADNHLVASWYTLVNTYGMDVEKDYTSSTYKTDTASPYCVLTNNPELSAGTKLIIGNSVTRVGNSAIRNCTNLTNVIIPDSITSIGAAAFGNCTSLTSITIPRSVTILGEFAFNSCNKLTTVTIGDGITSIPSYAFYSSTTILKSVTIPDSVTSIGGFAFSPATFFDGQIYYEGTEEQWSAITIESTNDWLAKATIHYNYTD